MVADCMLLKNYEPTLRFSKVTGVEYNRNTIVKDFLKTECEWLIMIDEDNPPLGNPLDLIPLNKDIIALPTMMWRGVGNPDGNEGLAFNVYRKIKNGWKTLVYDGKEKIFEADRVGTGCILIKRKVLEDFDAPFKCIVDKKTGIRKLGEDITFCDRAKKKGFKIWGHWDFVCSHYKEVDLLDVAQLLLKAYDKERNIGELTPRIETKR
jgi:hypothetical protein